MGNIYDDMDVPDSAFEVKQADKSKEPIPEHRWEPDFSNGEPPTDSKMCGLCGKEHAATPAPSQPAGAREKNWLVEAVENCPDLVLKQNCKQLLGNDYTNASVQFIADAQTAAKDAEIERLRKNYGDIRYQVAELALGKGYGSGRTFNEIVAAVKRLADRAEAAERDRDSVRAQLEIYKQTVLRLTEANAALKAGKDAHHGR